MSALRFIQLTDTHLFDHPDGSLYGIETARTLAAVVAAVGANETGVDALLATGDLTHDGGTPALRRFAHAVGALRTPVYCLPGNHDDQRLFDCALKRPGFQTCGGFVRGTWQTLLLNSAVPGAVHGHLPDAELARLEQALQAHPGHHALVCLHQHPIPTGSAWLDRHMLDNAGALFALLDRYPQVRGLLWGHVHQAFDARRGQLRLLATPSTCVQFKPGCADFTLDDAPPAYRWLNLLPDGGIETGVEYVLR